MPERTSSAGVTDVDGAVHVVKTNFVGARDVVVVVLILSNDYLYVHLAGQEGEHWASYLYIWSLAGQTRFAIQV